MRILSPNIGKEVVPIVKAHVYIIITDYGLKSLLKEIKIGPGQHTWYWVELRSDKLIDISDINGHYCTFNNAINRAVNNAYLTVYEFEDLFDMVENWKKIIYVENKKTFYKAEESD